MSTIWKLTLPKSKPQTLEKLSAQKRYGFASSYLVLFNSPYSTHYSTVIWCEKVDSLLCSAGSRSGNPSSWDSSKFHSLFIMVLSHNWKIVWRWNNRLSQQETLSSQVYADLEESGALIAFLATVFDPVWPQAPGCDLRPLCCWTYIFWLYPDSDVT